MDKPIPEKSHPGDESHPWVLLLTVEGQKVDISWGKEVESSAAPVSIILRSGATPKETLDALRRVAAIVKHQWPTLSEMQDEGGSATVLAPGEGSQPG